MVSDEFRAFQAQMASVTAAAQPDSLAERRTRMETAMSRLPLADGVTATAYDADGVGVISCRRDEGRDDPALLYFHGGGYRLGSATSYRAYGSHLARACSARVVLVDYRLAPEHPFPAAVDDALVAYKWLLGDQRVPADRVVVGGDSAGGGLAAALALGVRDEGLPLPAGVVCLSPWADLTNSASSYTRCADTDALFSKSAADEAARLYLDGADPAHPLVSPERGDWRGLPPLFIQASECEVLIDDATGLADRAGAAGVEVELHLYDDMPHVWQVHYPIFPEAVQAVDQIRAFVARVTSPSS
jgi:monoterpene epsilon-lactone hydrolase